MAKRVRRRKPKIDLFDGTTLAEHKCPVAPKPFSSDDDLLGAALQVFQIRQMLLEIESDPARDVERWRLLRDQEAKWTRYWHRSFQQTSLSVKLCERCKRHRLNRMEREVLVLLLLNHLGVLMLRIDKIADFLQMLRLSGKQRLLVPRILAGAGRLCRAGLVSLSDPDAEINERQLVVDPTLVDEIITKKTNVKARWPISTEAELYDQLKVLTRALERKSSAILTWSLLSILPAEAFKWIRKVDHLLEELHGTLLRHPKWKLNRLRQQIIDQQQWIICLALVGKELRHINPEDSLFTGGGLIRAAANDANNTTGITCLLTSKSDLLRQQLIRPCGGLAEFASDNSAQLEYTEYELTERTIQLLELNQQQVRRSSGEFVVREPIVHLSRLVLSNPVQQALDMALSHARHSDQLMVKWGLKEIIPYGHSPVLLFSGQPGTGKTAAAEAFAHELGKPILVADYSRIQNCFVGQTEKNIIKAFRAAQRQKAVLFWDEADAMFFDRDSARQNWEVRDVNVLLQELERFDGVCILATNRKITLDKALERRITLKVEFDRPDRRQRQGIWKKMLPTKMPLSEDVDLASLSETDFVGGEIKNVVLNAARLAAHRGCERVGMEDFQKAITMEQNGKWKGQSRRCVGFAG